MNQSTTKSIGSWNYNVQTQQVKLDKNALEIFGQPDFDGSVETFLSYIDEEDVTLVSRALDDTLKNGAHFEVAYSVRAVDGTTRKVSVIGNPVREQDGTVSEIRGVCETID